MMMMEMMKKNKIFSCVIQCNNYYIYYYTHNNNFIDFCLRYTMIEMPNFTWQINFAWQIVLLGIAMIRIVYTMLKWPISRGK
jgi:hypothetical protein